MHFKISCTSIYVRGTQDSWTDGWIWRMSSNRSSLKASENSCDKVHKVFNAEQSLTVRKSADKWEISKPTSHYIMVNRLCVNWVEKCMICWVLYTWKKPALLSRLLPDVLCRLSLYVLRVRKFDDLYDILQGL